MPEWDVVVVGAGPAGSVSAAQLARAGFKVLMVDRSQFPRNKPCAEYLSPGVLRLAQALGFWSIIGQDALQSTPGMDVIAPSGRALRLQYQVDGQSRFAATVPRRVLDDALVRHAVASGAQFEPGVVVREPIYRDGSVAGVVGSSGGIRFVHRSRLTIVADGHSSQLAQKLGLARTPRWPIRLGLVAHYEGAASLRAGFGQMHVESAGYCGVAPMSGSRLNVAVVSRADALKVSGLSATHFFENWIARNPRLHSLLANSRRISSIQGVGPIGTRAHHASVPGALLVGDAAGFFDPFTGEGIHRAMLSAELASRVAVEALGANDVSLHRLRAYDSLRQDAFRAKSAVTALVQLFVQFPALLEYAVPRLSGRPDPVQRLGAVLGDCADARTFLNARTVWSALRP